MLGRWGIGWRLGSDGTATNAIMTQVAAALNGNAIIKILRECLHKCLLSGETCGPLFFLTMNKFMSSAVCYCSPCLLISYAAASLPLPKR